MYKKTISYVFQSNHNSATSPPALLTGFDSMDGKSVHLIILVAAGEKQHREYLKLLSNIMSILKNDKVKEDIINSSSAEEVLKILKENS